MRVRKCGREVSKQITNRVHLPVLMGLTVFEMSMTNTVITRSQATFGAAHSL